MFVFFTTYVERLTDLPEASYREPSLILELVGRVGWPLSFLSAAIAALLARFGGLLAPWTELEVCRELRAFVMVLVAIMAWTFSTYGYNYYFDQGYYAERILLVALVPVIWWRPAFVIPFVVVAYTLLWQLAEPALGGSIFPHKLQILRAINIFAAAFLVYAVTGYRKAGPFLLLICSFVAAAYWISAIAKFELSWLTHGRVYLLPLSAYAHGWLAFLSPEKVVSIANLMAPFDVVLRIFVLAVETLGLIFLWRRRFSLALLVAWIIFHLGVFLLYGFFFWTWIVLDFALLVLLLRSTGAGGVDIYNLRNFVISIVLISFGAYWAQPPELGWLDTSLTYTYRIETVDEEGVRTLVHPNFFAPYEDVITMGSFAYLVNGRSVLVGAYGVTFDRALAKSLIGANDADDIFALEQQSDASSYNITRAAKFYDFLIRYLATRNKRGELAAVVRALHPPPQFWSFRGSWPDVGQSQISEVLLIEVTTFFNGERLEIIRERQLARLPIPRSPTP